MITGSLPLRLYIFSVLICVTTNYHLTFALMEIYNSPNVKTTLFTELDVRKSCWNHEEINLLRSRMIMQDLIPNKPPRDLQYLVEYLRSTEEAVVAHSPEGKVRRIMMMALSDVLGGYLQSVAIPLAKENYYAGNIDYATMSQLYEMLNEMKRRLRTDGGRWSRPIDMNKFSVKVVSLLLPMSNSELACRALFLVPEEKCAPGMPRIAIPYLDYDEKPGAVALPLKSRNLYSLKTAASSHIIVRFYMLARECLSEMPLGSTEVFNKHFVAWLTTKVVPHLYEDAWYPGFGSVMRIVDTINQTQLNLQPHRQFKFNDTTLEKSLLEGGSAGYISRMKAMAKYNTEWFVLYVFCVLFILSIILCCCCTCVWYLKSGKSLGETNSSVILNAVLSIFCGLQGNEYSKLDPNRLSSEYGEYYKGPLQYQPTGQLPAEYSGHQENTALEMDGESSTSVPTSSDEDESSSSD